MANTQARERSGWSAEFKQHRKYAKLVFFFSMSCHSSNLSLILPLTKKKTLQFCTFLSAFTPHYTMLPSTQNCCLGAGPTHCFQWNLLPILQQAAPGHKSSSGSLDVWVYPHTMMLLVCIYCGSQPPIQRSGLSEAVCFYVWSISRHHIQEKLKKSVIHCTCNRDCIHIRRISWHFQLQPLLLIITA